MTMDSRSECTVSQGSSLTLRPVQLSRSETQAYITIYEPHIEFVDHGSISILDCHDWPHYSILVPVFFLRMPHLAEHHIVDKRVAILEHPIKRLRSAARG